MLIKYQLLKDCIALWIRQAMTPYKAIKEQVQNQWENDIIFCKSLKINRAYQLISSGCEEANYVDIGTCL